MTDIGCSLTWEKTSVIFFFLARAANWRRERMALASMAGTLRIRMTMTLVDFSL